MESKFQLLTTREFNGLHLDCYRDESQQDTENAFWATREQIGKLLGYTDPADAIRKIHKRNKERLNKFSRGDKLSQVEGTRTVTREVIMYNFKGLLEICRYSQQPNANAVIDVLWEIADEIRQKGMYLSPEVSRLYNADPESFKKLLDAYLEEKRENQKLREEIEASRAVKVIGTIVMARKDAFTFQEAAQFLAQHGFETGQNRLFKKCRDKKLLCSRKGRQFNRPTQRAIEQGLLNTQILGTKGVNTIAMVTPKGLQYLTDVLSEENYPLLLLIEKASEK